MFWLHEAEVSIYQLLLFLRESYVYQQILQLFPGSCVRDLSERRAYVQVLEGIIQKAQESTLEKTSMEVATVFLTHFGCPTVKEVGFVYIAMLL